MTDNKTTIRRARISNYLDDNPDIGMDSPKQISDELGIPYKTVRNDLNLFRLKLKADYKQYNLEGLRKKGLEKVNRLNELILKTRTIIDNTKHDPEMILKAISLESNLLNNLHHLEHDGVGIITVKIEERKNELENTAS